jgi:tRNA (guanine37-N1)-methyltransferase
MKFNIISIFPETFKPYFNESILKKAQEKKIVEINLYNLRDFAKDKHKTLDDTIYGGGAGMLLKIEPIYRAIKKTDNKRLKRKKTILLSAKGKKWNQRMAEEYKDLKEITLVCGRYEGVDERIKHFIDEEISIGDYILTGGELGAMIIVDSVTRLLPGVLGNPESLKDESHNKEGLLECPHYTKPPIFKAKNKEYKVPEVLISGNHKLIKEWQEKNRPKPSNPVKRK